MYDNLVEALRNPDRKYILELADEAADAIEGLCKKLERQNKIIELAQQTERQALADRDAAVCDIEEIMFVGKQNIETCDFCITQTCYNRGGNRPCAPEWRGRRKEN